MQETGLRQQSFLWFEAAEAVRGQGSHAGTTGGMTICERTHTDTQKMFRERAAARSDASEVTLTVAGVVLRVQPLPTGLHTLALVEKESVRAQGAVGSRGAPAGGAGGVTGCGGMGGGTSLQMCAHHRHTAHTASAYLCICCACPGNAEPDTGRHISHDARRSPAGSSYTWGCQGNRRRRTNHRLRSTACKNMLMTTKH